MPRLFICTPSYYLQGGVERILESLARGLPSRGFEVVFGLAKGARFHDPARFRAAFPDVRGVDVDGTSGTVYGRRSALRRAIEAVDPDVVLIARMFDAYPVCSELKLRGHRLRLAVTVQAYEAEYFVDLARYQDFVDLCVTSGERIAATVRALTTLTNVVSIPGGVAPPHRVRVPHDGPLRIGYVGRIEQVQKRLRDLPLLRDELTRRGVPFTLDVAGDGTLADELRAQLPEARFHGWLSARELYERVYPELDVVVHFAEWEGMTIAPREAMAHGVVPVVSRFTGAEDFIDGVNALTFDVGDIRAAADALESLHRDRARLETLSRAARDSQQGIRSEEGAIDAWAAAFRDALARPPRIGTTFPDAPRDAGLLTRLHLPPTLAELVRRVRRRAHAAPGDEWPHWSGMPDAAIVRAVAEGAAPSGQSSV
ncbi:MAG: glycosyltransferase family 4 protein [Acidobacteria bacterium]|nr:glycosyltransferase family 4 protein [Acidobacteriota bacterium]MBV9476490.1 glycosyltransferase family 4 protein [Acidobacteriota bacterium]